MTGAASGPVVITSGLVRWRLVALAGGMAQFAGELVDKSTASYAVHIAFDEVGGTLEWTFARALIIGGLIEPIGVDDVVISPSRPDGLNTVQITLMTHEACAVLEAPAGVVAAFLKRTCEAVPPGSENRHIDFDHLARRLVQDSG